MFGKLLTGAGVASLVGAAVVTSMARQVASDGAPPETAVAAHSAILAFWLTAGAFASALTACSLVAWWLMRDKLATVVITLLDQYQRSKFDDLVQESLRRRSASLGAVIDIAHADRRHEQTTRWAKMDALFSTVDDMQATQRVHEGQIATVMAALKEMPAYTEAMRRVERSLTEFGVRMETTVNDMAKEMKAIAREVSHLRGEWDGAERRRRDEHGHTQGRREGDPHR